MPTLFQRRLERPFTAEAVRQLRDDHLAACEAAGLQGPQCWEVVSVADELASNVVEHGRASWMEVRLEDQGGELALQVADDGRAFNTMAEALKREGDIIAGTERGVGLFLVNRFSRQLSYARLDPGKNQLTVMPRRRPGAGILGGEGTSWKN